jgi:site-specific DNA-adenine methylase
MNINEKMDLYLEEIELNEVFFDKVKTYTKKVEKLMKGEIEKIKSDLIKLYNKIKEEIQKFSTEMAFGDNKKKAQKNRDSMVELMNKIELFAKQNELKLG